MIDDAASAFSQSAVFWVAATLAAYELGCRLQRRCGGSAVVNPVLVAIVVIGGALELFGVSYDTYRVGGSLIEFLLGPVTIALALPIYDNLGRIRSAAPAIFTGVAVGAGVACASAVAIAWLLGVPAELLRSIAPKSTTLSIAIGVSQEIGGFPSVTAILVIATGIIGAILSGRVFDWIGVRDWEARGLATGIAGHGIGTAQMLAVDETAGAFAGCAIGLTGLFTAVALPIAVSLLG
jgi:predicted murein hydrolase (TIGR00659 family)